MSQRKQPARPARPTPATPEAYDANATQAAASRAPKPRRRGRWRRWLLIVVALIVLLRVALALATPAIVHSALESAGLRGGYDSLSLSLVGGSVELEGIELWPVHSGAGSTEAPLRLEHAHVDVGLLPLLGGRYVVEDVTLAGLHVAARRAADGSLHIGGLSLPAEDAPTDAPAEAPAEPEAAPPGSPPSDEAPPLITLEHLSLSDIELAWTDESLQPALATTLRLGLSGEALQAGPGAREGRFELALSADDECERLALLGTLRADPDAAALDARLELRGLHAGPLSRYLPPGVTDELGSGSADVRLVASWTAAESGGAARLELSGFDLHDAQGPPLLAFDSLRLDAPRLDAEGGVFALNDLVLMGLRGRARMDAAGTLHVLGFALAAPQAEADGVAAASAASAPTAATTKAAPTTTSSNAAPTPGTASPSPRVSLERLDLELAEFSFIDERQAGAAPLVAGLRLQNRDPLVLLDADLEALPPLRLLLTARAAPLVEQVRVELEAAPWQSPATLTVGLAVTGLRGAGLTELQPSLAAELDGAGLVDGRLSAELHVELDLRRRGAQLDLSQGFGARMELRELALRDGAEGAVLAGLRGLEIEAPRIDPAGGLVHLRTLSLDTPQLHLQRDVSGLHVAGLLLRAPPPVEPSEGAAGESADAPSDVTAAGTVETTVDTTAAATPSGPEVRIDRLDLHGLDFGFVDSTTTPPCVVALNSLEVEVRRFTTLAFTEPKSIHFSVYLGAGEIELPRRTTASSIFAGLATAAAQAVTGGEDERQLESRPLFGEVALTGALKLAPALTGSTRFSLSGLELLSLAGPASAAGVEIGDGLLDATVNARFRGEQGFDLDTRLLFTDLSLSEPADGPIATYLKLPAPLDSVLFLLRNERGEHKIDFGLSVPQGGVGGGRVAAAAGAAIGEVVGRAITAVPARMLTSVTDLMGVTGGEDAPPQPEFTLLFEPGSTALPEVSSKDLRNALTRMLSEGDAVLALEHHLGRGDLVRADQLGNPSAEQCSQRAAQLRQQRAELLRRQAECSAEARALLLVGRVPEAESARARLIEAEQQLCLTESALDNVFERLRPGAERYREQRARVAALQIGQARLEAVRRALLALGLPRTETRVELRPPRLEPIEGDEGGTVLATLKGQ